MFAAGNDSKDFVGVVQNSDIYTLILCLYALEGRNGFCQFKFAAHALCGNTIEHFDTELLVALIVTKAGMDECSVALVVLI